MNPEDARPLVDVFVLRSLAAAEEQLEAHCHHGQLESCLDLHGIVPQRNYLTADGRRMLCHFWAPDADSLRLALRVAHIDYEAVWSAKLKIPAGAADSKIDCTPASTPSLTVDARTQAHGKENKS